MITATQVTTCHVRGLMAHILLIDDDEAVRAPTARLLELMGHEVQTAEHGEAGLEVWREGGADLVITDVCMPGMSGLDVIVQLRAFAPDLPILAMSGGLKSQRLDLEGTASKAGPIRALEKPFTIDELRSAVGELLRPQHRPKQA
jgi:DNA-binding NtrC family response regulator